MAPRLRGVAAPPFTPRPAGLFSVAAPTAFADAREVNGIEFRAEPYAEARTYADTCEVPAGDRTKVFDGSIDYVEGDPFTVYGGDVCAPVGVELTERDRRAIAAVTNGEERAVERALWTGTATNGEAITPAFEGGGGVQAIAGTVTLVAALAALEERLAALYGGVGVIHVPVDAALFGVASDALVRESSGRILTALVTPVAAGGGYPGTGPAGQAKPAGGSYLFATGPVAVRRGTVEQLGGPGYAGRLDRSVNTLVAVGERPYVLAYAGPLLYALADYES